MSAKTDPSLDDDEYRPATSPEEVRAYHSSAAMRRAEQRAQQREERSRLGMGVPAMLNVEVPTNLLHAVRQAVAPEQTLDQFVTRVLTDHLCPPPQEELLDDVLGTWAARQRAAES